MKHFLMARIELFLTGKNLAPRFNRSLAASTGLIIACKAKVLLALIMYLNDSKKELLRLPKARSSRKRRTKSKHSKPSGKVIKRFTCFKLGIVTKREICG